MAVNVLTFLHSAVRKGPSTANQTEEAPQHRTKLVTSVHDWRGVKGSCRPGKNYCKCYTVKQAFL